jgi:acetyl-CoA acetyltransferase
LLADFYTQRYPEDRRVFQRVVAKNAANAMASDETFIRHAPSLAEVVRDFPVATPLVRSDFAPLIDGATAVLLTDLESARAVCETVVEVVGVAAAADVSVVADRVDALRLDAVTEATAAAVDPQTRRSLRVLETHNPCSVLEVLTLESAGFIEWGHAGRAYREGFGLRTSALPVNPGGGSQGRGLAFGVSGLEQTRELFLQLSGAAGSRQVESARTDPEARGLAIATAGLATCAYATVLGKAQ